MLNPSSITLKHDHNKEKDLINKEKENYPTFDKDTAIKIERLLSNMKENSCQICKLFFKEKYTKKSLVKTAMKVSEYQKCDLNMREQLVNILVMNKI